MREQGDLAGIANALLFEIEAELGLQLTTDELKVRQVQNSPLGDLVRFDQYYQQLRVWPAELSVQLNSDQHVVAVRGNYIGTPVTLDLTPRLSEQDAVEAALRSVDGTAKPCPLCRSELAIYVNEAQQPLLAYEVQTATHQFSGWHVFVDATSGRVLFKQPSTFSKGSKSS